MRFSSCFISVQSRSLSLNTFFFNRGGPPRHLPSFPTRRSSDLAGLQMLEGAVPREAVTTCAAVTHPAERYAAMRSEEHTSELQSLTNLVCRLLLEKKKITTSALSFQRM